jgi:hypothetical protein
LRSGRTLFATTLLGLACAQVPPARALEVDTSNRAAVIAFYRETYLASENVSPGFTGNVAACDAGTIEGRYAKAALTRILYFRAMAGLDGGLMLSRDWGADCQKAALMMSANRDLSHAPPTSWKCYTKAGARAASKSNLAYGYPTLPDAITGLMKDRTNPRVGHRRWFLYPPLDTVGIGAVFEGEHPAYALHVIGGAGARPRAPEWVAWPSRGYFPHAFVPPGWSFSYPGANFSKASVTMRHEGRRLKVALNSVQNGFGDNTLVWTPKGIDPAPPARDETYHVTITNVVIEGVSRDFAYDVIVIDPGVPASAHEEGDR